jgi:RecA-family ATPase
MSTNAQPLPADGSAEKFKRKSKAVQQFSDWTEFDYCKPQPLRYMGEWLKQGQVTTVFAPSGVGKSFLFMDAARSIALGDHAFEGAKLLRNDCYGRKTRGLLCTTEMDDDDIHFRHGPVFIEPLRVTEGNERYKQLEMLTKYQIKSLDEDMPDLLTEIEEHVIDEKLNERPFQFVIIDNLTTAYPDLISSNEGANTIMKKVGMLAYNYNLAILQVMHINKKGQAVTSYDKIDADAIKGNKMLHITSHNMIGFNSSKGSDNRFYAIQLKSRTSKKADVYTADNCAVFDIEDVDYSSQLPAAHSKKTFANVKFYGTSTEDNERQLSKTEMRSDVEDRCFRIWDEDTRTTGEPSKMGSAAVQKLLESYYANAAGTKPLSDATIKNYKKKWRDEYEAGNRPDAHAE